MEDRVTSVADSFFARLLRAAARLVCRHPQWFVLPQIVLFGLCVFYTVRNLEFDMSQDNLVGADKKYHQVFMKFRQEFPGQDEMAVVVESEDLDRNRQFVERLAARLEPETNLFTDIFYKGDLPSLGPKALLFVPENDLKELRAKLKDFNPFIEQFTEATNLDSFFALVNKQFRTAKRETNAANDAMISAIPALQRIIEQGTDSMSRTGTTRLARRQCASSAPARKPSNRCTSPSPKAASTSSPPAPATPPSSRKPSRACAN